MAKTLEVHEHLYISGPYANGGAYGPDGKWHTGKFSHSHEGGDQPHRHAETGPSGYQIDKAEWFRETGLRGGGRKKFTAKPTGIQLPAIPLTLEERTFQVIIGKPTPEQFGTGPGEALPMRLILGLKMTPTIREDN